MAILNEEQNNRFLILCKEMIPEYMRRTQDTDPIFGDSRDRDIFNSFYKYDNENIDFIFTRLHFEINEWIKGYSTRFTKGNRYICAGDRGTLDTFNSILCGFTVFFQKIGFEFYIVQEYRELIYDGRKEILNAEKYVVDDFFTLPSIIIDEPIFFLKGGKKLDNIKYLIFGAAKTKPDIRVSDVLDGNLDILNHNDVLVYDDEIKDSLLYADFNVWWEKSKGKYSWYKPAEQMNEMELKFAKYYQNNYKADNFPVLIPQVYLHYDPKDKEVRNKYTYTKTLAFQRMDFLIIYKGKRIVIEIDGKTHTPENSLEQYSRQTEYDRTMKFLGYEVFRIGGYELTHSFETTVKNFFDNLIKYLTIKQKISSRVGRVGYAKRQRIFRALPFCFIAFL